MSWNPENYPPPAVPISPQLSFGGMFGSSSTSVPSLLDTNADVQFVTSGRVALARGLRSIGVGKGDAVLVPAYHCPSLVDPVPWLEATPIYYRLKEDLQPDFEHLLSVIDDSVRALVVVHYFGFAQAQISRLVKLCTERGIHLVEDCAHAMFGSADEQTIGSMGSFAIASPAKFFPIMEGGLLISNDRAIQDDAELERGGLAFELKAIVSPVEKSVNYGHFFPFNTLFKMMLWIKDVGWRGLKKLKGGASDNATMTSPGSADGGFAFDPQWLNIRISRASKVIMGISSKTRNIEKRRENYQKYVQAFQHTDHCSVMISSLPEHAVPYVFPMLIENDNYVFDKLRLQGVPIYRWDALYTDCCAISNRYSTQLFQFPCHQDLKASELDWIIDRINEALQ